MQFLSPFRQFDSKAQSTKSTWAEKKKKFSSLTDSINFLEQRLVNQDLLLYGLWAKNYFYFLRRLKK